MSGWNLAGVCAGCLFVAATALGQRVAIVSPDRSPQSTSFVEKLSTSFQRPLDSDLAWAAFSSSLPSNPYNMSVEEAKLAGIRVGCDVLILVRSEVLRRSSFSRQEYYEAYAAVFTVSSRSGRLVDWRLLSFEAARPEGVAKRLDESIAATAGELEQRIAVTAKRELNEPVPPVLAEPPDDKSPPDPAFRSPLPYRRIKPDYTTQANLYGVAATVEITVDLDAAGQITRTEITRWAGYGLDEAVEKAVRSMNWRAADRNGKPLAMRFTLQYNFKKVENK